jgi:hypothetical protein
VPQIQGAAAKAAAVAKQQQDGKASKAQRKEKQVAIINLLRHPEEKIPRSFGEATDIPGLAPQRRECVTTTAANWALAAIPSYTISRA